jgi:hypothetical protein
MIEAYEYVSILRFVMGTLCVIMFLWGTIHPCRTPTPTDRLISALYLLVAAEFLKL